MKIIELKELDPKEFSAEEGFIERRMSINKYPDKLWIDIFDIKKGYKNISGDITFVDPSVSEKLIIPKKGEEHKKFKKLKPYIAFIIHKSDNPLEYVENILKRLFEDTNKEYNEKSK